MLRVFLRRPGDQKSLFDWTDAAGSERRASAEWWLGWFHCTAAHVKHGSDTAGCIPKTKGALQGPPPTNQTPFQPRPFTCCPSNTRARQSSSSESQSGKLTVSVLSVPRPVIEKRTIGGCGVKGTVKEVFVLALGHAAAGSGELGDLNIIALQSAARLVINSGSPLLLYLILRAWALRLHNVFCCH